MAATHPFSTLPDTVVRESSQSKALDRAGTGKYKVSTLLLRLTLLNLLAMSLLIAAWWEGLVGTVIAADKTYLTVLIAAVFAVGLVISFWRAMQITRDIDQHKLAIYADESASSGHPKVPVSMGALRLRLTHRIASVRHIANVLVLLGLIGTVLGFIIALSGVDPETASDIDGIAPMVSTLIQGMSTALYTTLVGSILNVWLTANHQMLASGTVELMSLWMERHEQPDTAAKHA